MKLFVILIYLSRHFTYSLNKPIFIYIYISESVDISLTVLFSSLDLFLDTSILIDISLTVLTKRETKIILIYTSRHFAYGFDGI